MENFDPKQYKILCVDDEANILSSLRRMLSLEGYQVSIAQSGAEALQTLSSSSFDVLISDMRMPQMDGAELLSLARKKYPLTIRILLTGAADVNSAISAVNEGEIFRFMTKPWNDAELLNVIQVAALQGKLERDKEVKLRASYVSTLKTFSGLMALRRPDLLTHSRRVAQLSRRVARGLGCTEPQAQEIYIAGLLHDLGKIGLSDRILSTKFIELPLGDAKIYRKHGEMGQSSLKILPELEDVGRIVRSHHEYFDGSGYPDKLMGDSISQGARILAVVEAFEELVAGEYSKTPHTPKEALKIIVSNRGKLFCPQVCDVFVPQMASLINEVVWLS